MRIFSLLLCAAFLLAGCSTTKTSTNDGTDMKVEETNQNSVEVNTAETGTDLTLYFRKVAGVAVRGSGENASIQVRGMSSFGGDTRPLFVIDGRIFGNDYSALYTAIDPNEIRRVTVLKSASETAEYGVRGGNGVILISLRK